VGGWLTTEQQFGKKAIEKVKLETSQKLTDTQPRESIAQKFVGNADSLQTGYDTSNFREVVVIGAGYVMELFVRLARLVTSKAWIKHIRS
jgi:hypothetical protein